MKIVHKFLTTCHNLTDLFKDVKTLKDFMKNLEKQSLLSPLNYDPDKYKGDGFEFFIELFCKLHPCDSRLSINHYLPNQVNITEKKDNGVDGICLNNRLENSVVQIKYRSDTTKYLVSDDLKNFYADGRLRHNVDFDTVNQSNFRHFVFTTAAGLNFYTDKEIFEQHIKCFGFNELRQFVDNNLPFWDYVNKLIIK